MRHSTMSATSVLLLSVMNGLALVVKDLGALAVLGLTSWAAWATPGPPLLFALRTAGAAVSRVLTLVRRMACTTVPGVTTSTCIVTRSNATQTD